jgi:hypothetical protein
MKATEVTVSVKLSNGAVNEITMRADQQMIDLELTPIIEEGEDFDYLPDHPGGITGRRPDTVTGHVLTLTLNNGATFWTGTRLPLTRREVLAGKLKDVRRRCRAWAITDEGDES